MSDYKHIAIISKTDETGGGASRIAAGLANLLNTSTSFKAHHWVGQPGPNINWSTKKLHGGRWLSLLQGAFAVSSRVVGFPDFFTPELLIHHATKSVDYDWYHLHDISFTFSPIALNWLAKLKPVFWTLHDCSPFTGGCIYPLKCSAFQSRCRNCPQLSIMPLGTKYDFTGWMQAYKSRLVKNKNIILVSPSQWLIHEAHKSPFVDIPIHHIPNYIDPNVFRPIPKHIARQALGLPEDRFIVLVSATSLADERKGFAYAIESLLQLNEKPYILLVGAYNEMLENAIAGFDHHISGYVYNDKLLAQYYSASDVLLFTSIADNLPTVVLETMACGIPTIGFKTGGVPEMVTHNIHGWLAEQNSIQELVEGLNIAMHEPDKLKQWGQSSLEKCLSEYNPQKFLDAHLSLYENSLSNFS